MPSYLIVNIEVTDPARYAEYIKVVPESIAAFGGTYLVRGGKAEVLEGSWVPKRVVVLRFETFERAKAWWASDEYRAPKALRQSASIADIVLVEGL